MKRTLLILAAIAPSLHAQRQTDSVVSTPSTVFSAPLLSVSRTIRAPTCGDNGPRTLSLRCASDTERRLAFDSTALAGSHGHTALGVIAGLALGVGVGYLVATTRVPSIERTSDGPFQQIEYFVDPIVGGLVGSVVGGIVGSNIRD